MKQIKSILILSIVFILSGCTINYNVEINEDKSIKENIEVFVPAGIINMYYDDNIEGYYNDMYDTYKEEYEFTDYEKNINSSRANSHIKLDKSYCDIYSYFNSKHFNVLFENVNIQNINDEYIVKLSGYKDMFNTYEDPNFSVEPFNITLKSKYIIKESNADIKNFLTGTYIWNFDKTIEDKTIEFTISDKTNYFSKIFGNKILFYSMLIIIIIVVGLIVYGVLNNRLKKVNEI